MFQLRPEKYSHPSQTHIVYSLQHTPQDNPRSPAAAGWAALPGNTSWVLPQGVTFRSHTTYCVQHIYNAHHDSSKTTRPSDQQHLSPTTHGGHRSTVRSSESATKFDPIFPGSSELIHTSDCRLIWRLSLSISDLLFSKLASPICRFGHSDRPLHCSIDHCTEAASARLSRSCLSRDCKGASGSLEAFPGFACWLAGWLDMRELTVSLLDKLPRLPLTCPSIIIFTFTGL